MISFVLLCLAILCEFVASFFEATAKLFGKPVPLVALGLFCYFLSILLVGVGPAYRRNSQTQPDGLSSG